MQVTQRSRLRLRLQGLLFTVLFAGIIGMLAWLSTQYTWQADWTAGARNTVSADTRKLLGTLTGPVAITAYVGNDDLLRQQIRGLVGSYQRFKPDITLEFINPDTVPEQMRELGISKGGAIVIRYHDASDRIQSLSEQQLTNALMRLSRQDQRWVVFITGHGERPPTGDTNFGMGVFGAELERKGLHVQTINLADSAIPSNTSLLVLASPRVALLPGEVQAIDDYVGQGGNLLWLSEPGALPGLQPLAEQLGLSQLPGKVVDASSAAFAAQNPGFVVITGYPDHPVTHDLGMVTVFPETAAFEIHDQTAFRTTPLLTTLARSWTETGKLEGEIRYNADSDEHPGPLDIGVALTREKPGGKDQEQQRIAVIGDGDFLSNTYLGNGGNLDLGLNLLLWLSHDDAFIDIRVRSAPDTSLQLGNTALAAIGFGFLFAVPGLLLLAGIVIWWRRRRR
jgi:gliding motility-associatede transport system auxiliary component